MYMYEGYDYIGEIIYGAADTFFSLPKKAYSYYAF